MTALSPPLADALPSALDRRLRAVASELEGIRTDMAHLSPSQTSEVADALVEVENRVASIQTRMDWIRWRRHAGTRPVRV